MGDQTLGYDLALFRFSLNLSWCPKYVHFAQIWQQIIMSHISGAQVANFCSCKQAHNNKQSVRKPRGSFPRKLHYVYVPNPSVAVSGSDPLSPPSKSLGVQGYFRRTDRINWFLRNKAPCAIVSGVKWFIG